MLNLILQKISKIAKCFYKCTKVSSRQTKILIVDDHKINLIALKTKIEKLLPAIECDIAIGGRKAIKKAKKYPYNLINMDLQMPDIDGIETSRIIRENSITTPIIAATSLSYETFMEEVNKRGGINYMVDYIPKTAPSNYFMRAIAKHILTYKDDFSYLGDDKELIRNILKDKKIILADDQDLNRVMVSKIMDKYQVLCKEASSGEGVLDLYNKSLDNHGKSSLDAIITDINMPPFNGDQVSSEIRKIEISNKILFADRIPIIAISGDNSFDMVTKLFKSGMDDYFTKGDNFDNLAKILANFFIDIDIRENSLSDSDNKNSSSAQQEERVFNSSFIDNFSDSEKTKITKLFVEDCERTIANIKKYHQIKDLEKLNVNLHSLKGIVANFGAEKLSTYIKIIDKSVKADTAEDNWVSKVEELYEELAKYLKDLYLK